MDRLALLIVNLMAVAILFWLFDRAYKAYRLDLLRCYIFRARDKLFEAAERGVIPFDHAAYGMTRQMLNGMIRFAHELGLWQSIMFLIGRRWLADVPAAQHFWRNYEMALRSLPNHARQPVLSAMADAHVAVFSYVLHTSIVTFPFIFIMKWVLRVGVRFRRFGQLRKAIPATAKETLDHHAYEIGA